MQRQITEKKQKPKSKSNSNKEKIGSMYFVLDDGFGIRKFDLSEKEKKFFEKLVKTNNIQKAKLFFETKIKREKGKI